MARLDFDVLKTTWHGNDLSNVDVVKITGLGGVSALLYTCFVNIDYDGAANAYGSPGTSTLESRANGGYPRYYNGGIMAVHPQARLWDMDDSFENFKIGTKGPFVKDHCKLNLDLSNPDSKGRCPVFQQPGVTSGYYVSGISFHKPFTSVCDQYKQANYPDASLVGYGALSDQLEKMGKVKTGDFGLAIRHGIPRQSTFYFADGGHKKEPKRRALGECSYRVFLDLGGEAKLPNKTPNNRFAVSFLIFPGSGSGSTDDNTIANGIRTQVSMMSQADNSYELPLLMAYAGARDGKINGDSGMKPLEASRKQDLRATLKLIPFNYNNVVLGLTAYGFPGDPLALSRGRVDPNTPVLVPPRL